MARDRTAERERGADDRGGSSLDRRGYLRLSAGATVAGVMGTGSATAGSADATNVVASGADPTGETAIDDVLEAVARDGETLVFPAGTYRIEGVTLQGYEGLELVGHRGATLLFAEGPASSLAFEDSKVAVMGFAVDADASGIEGASAGAADPVHTLEVAADDGSDVNYRVTVDGDLWRQPTDEGASGERTAVSGTSAEGVLADGVVTYEYTGSITDTGLLGDATVTVDGRTVEADRLRRRARPTALTVDSDVDHTVDVDGDLERTADGYRFAGDLVSFRLSEASSAELTRA